MVRTGPRRCLSSFTTNTAVLRSRPAARLRRRGSRVPTTGRAGPRAPISPLVAARSTPTALHGPDFHFDHTSIIKTILTRFCAVDGQIPAMTERVAAANHLCHLLSDVPARDSVADHGMLGDQLTQWRAGLDAARFADATALAPPLPHQLTEPQTGFTDVKRLLRAAGLPDSHP